MDSLFQALSLIKHLASEKMSILNTEKKRSIFMAPLFYSRCHVHKCQQKIVIMVCDVFQLEYVSKYVNIC